MIDIVKYLKAIYVLLLVYSTISCSNDKLEEKGFQVSPILENSETDQIEGLIRDSLKIDTRPSSVLLTGLKNVRLTTIYKVNQNKRTNSTIIGSNSFHYRYEDIEGNTGNNWNSNLMPGLEAVYGYNLVNISHYDIREDKQKLFFEKPVLIKTLYYPTFSKDTLNNTPINRDYFMVSVYNDDTNKDNFVNQKDLRRLYLFDKNGQKQKSLVTENYSVFKSEYDSDNDLMFVFAQLDNNNNGSNDEGEPIHIFWIELQDPTKTGRLY